ncbi:acyl-CoA dehydrogenase family protein [Lysinibacillus sp. 54212]|uniref:acyl-CoA dehydrogenase family protein n=1 Tax=Lysinibacillus sp. 54212 TaxID=3119829 RepID=UPI002FCA2515
MDFTFTEKEEAFRLEIRTWLNNNLPQGWLDGTYQQPETEEERIQFLKDWQRKLYEGGLAAIAWPDQYGGRNATLMEEIIFQQEMASVKAPPIINYVGTHMVGPTLMGLGTEQQKQEHIQKILTGETIWCQGYSEPNAGSDLSAIQTRAVKHGDKWLINGQKIWTSFGHVADYCFLLARTNTIPEKKHKGITVFLVDMHQPGIEVVPILSMNGEHDFNEVFFTDVEAYDHQIVGNVDEGWGVTMSLLMHERTGIGGQLFTLQQQFEDFVKLAKTNEEILGNPIVRQKMVELYAKSKGALFGYYKNLTKQLKQGYPGAESSIDKLMVAELTKELFSFIQSVQGPESILWKEDSLYDTYWQNNYLTSFGLTIGGGTSEIQRNTIGERILGLPKDISREKSTNQVG